MWDGPAVCAARALRYSCSALGGSLVYADGHTGATELRRVEPDLTIRCHVCERYTCQSHLADRRVMRYWLMKSEPDEFSIDDLAAAPGQTTAWFGVRNYQARNFMRDQMRVGDQAFFYHSSCPQPGIA